MVTEVWKALQGEEALAKEDHGAVAYKVSILKTEPLLPEHSPNFKLQMRVFRGNCEVSNANKQMKIGLREPVKASKPPPSASRQEP